MRHEKKEGKWRDKGKEQRKMLGERRKLEQTNNEKQKDEKRKRNTPKTESKLLIQIL